MITEEDEATLAKIVERVYPNLTASEQADIHEEVLAIIRGARESMGWVTGKPDRHSINGLCIAINLVIAAELMLRQAGIEMELPVPEIGRKSCESPKPS